MTDHPIFPADFIQAIQDSVAPIAVEGDNDSTYYNRPLYLPPAEPLAKAIQAQTLSGLADYVTSIVDSESDTRFAHIVSHAEVSILSELSELHRQRETLLTANCSQLIGKGFRFGEWLPLENFTIALQSQFADTGDRAQVLTILGNMRNDTIRTLEDDGVSQLATVKTGISTSAVVPNPVKLAPFRTFAEVEQPISLFVLRVRNEKDSVHAALFEADGGAWKLEAIQAIQKWLESALPEDFAILA